MTAERPMPRARDPLAPAEVDGFALFRNTGYNLAGRLLPMLAAAIAIPPLMAELGPSRFGVLALAWVLTGYFGIFDLGLGEASTKYVAEALGRGERSHARSILQAATLLQTATGILAGVLLWFGAPLVSTGVFRLPDDLGSETTWCFRILALSFPVAFATGALRGAVGAAQRFDLVNRITVPLGVCNSLLPLLGVALGWGLPGIMGLLVASRVLGWVLFRRCCERLFPATGAITQPRSVLIHRLLGFGLWAMVSSVVGPILAHGERVFIASMLSVAAVGIYAAPFEIISRAAVLVPSLAVVLLPAFSTLAAAGSEERALRFFSRAVKVILLGVFPAFGLAAIYAPLLLGWWLGPAYDPEQATVFRILALGLALNGLAHVPYTLIKGTGRPDLPAKFHLIELPAHLLLLYFLLPVAGLTGAALAWTLRSAIDMVLLWSALGRLDRASFAQAARRSVAPSMIVVIGFIGTAAGVHMLHLPLLWETLLVAATIACMAGLTWRLGLDDGERVQVVRLLRRGLRRQVGETA